MVEFNVLELETLRPRLVAIAYQMTGDQQEAADLVQDCYEAWLSSRLAAASPAAYLRKMVVNRSIDRLKALKKQRETYKGVWLPAPHVTEPAADLGLADDDEVSLAVLHLLEKLNPPERAVFILKESFGYAYDDIAELCHTSQQNCRQLLHRARQKLQLPTTRFRADEQQYQQLLDAFLAACHDEQPEPLAHLLQADVVLYADGGGKMTAVPKPVQGARAVSRLLRNVILPKVSLQQRRVLVNGLPGLLFFDPHTGRPDTVFTMAVAQGQITALYFIRNPDKLGE